MTRYRTGTHWRQHTIILEGTQSPDPQGRREDDRPVAFVDSAAPEGLAQRIVDLLNGEGVVPGTPLSGYRHAVAALAQARKTRGLSQFDLADRAGVSRRMITAWERGNTQPLAGVLFALAHALGYDLALVRREDQP